jgi:hypothetical protein
MRPGTNALRVQWVLPATEVVAARLQRFALEHFEYVGSRECSGLRVFDRFGRSLRVKERPGERIHSAFFGVVLAHQGTKRTNRGHYSNGRRAVYRLVYRARRICTEISGTHHAINLTNRA